MVVRIISATEAKPGVNIIYEGAPLTVKSLDISKTGKHGAHKCRIEAIGIIDGKKRIILKPGHERFEVPEIIKRKGQVISIIGNDINIMDIESFETITLQLPEELKDAIEEGSQLEYWDVEGEKIIKRIM